MEESRAEGSPGSIADPRSLFETLFEQSPVAFQIYRLDGHCLLVNPAFRQLFGTEPPPEYNVLEDDVLARNGFLPQVHRAFAGETVVTDPHWYDPRELRQVAVPDGRRVGVEVTMFPLRDCAGTVRYIALSFKDVTVELERQRERDHFEQVARALERTESELAATLDSIGDAVIATDLEGRIVWLNPVAERLTGWQRADAWGLALADVFRIAGHEGEPPAEALTRALADRVTFWLPGGTALVSRAGATVPIDGSIAPICDGGAAPRGFVLVFRDMTEKARAEEALRRNAARMQILADSSRQFSAASADLRGLIDLVARRLGQLHGDACAIRLIARDGEWMDSGATVHHPDPDLAETAAQVLAMPQRVGEGLMGRVAATAQPVLVPAYDSATMSAHLAEPYRAMVERLGVNSVMAVPLRSRDRVIGVAALYRSRRDSPYMPDDLQLAQDLADRAALAIENALLMAELEERVALRTAALEEANRELEAFSYTVSHDLRTPLRAIDGFTYALGAEYGDKLDDRFRDYLRRVQNGARRMSALIDDLLHLARIHRSPIRPRAIDLSGLAGSVIDEIRRQDPTREVEVEIAEGVSGRGDARLIRIVLENLLGNAWKFTVRRPDARIAFGQTGGAFFVRDNGIGFDMAYVSRLFAPFQRLHRDTDFEGTGIGLATVHRIISRHGGRIWAEAEMGQGATFLFTLGER